MTNVERAYRNTAYCVDCATGNFAIRIGEPCAALDALLLKHGVTSWAYVTACNPRSQPLPPAENAARHAQLLCICAVSDRLYSRAVANRITAIERLKKVCCCWVLTKMRQRRSVSHSGRTRWWWGGRVEWRSSDGADGKLALSGNGIEFCSTTAPCSPDQAQKKAGQSPAFQEYEEYK